MDGPGVALDLETIERATEASRAEGIGGMEIVVAFDEPECEMVLPLGRAEPRGGRASSVHPRAPKRPFFPGPITLWCAIGAA